MEREVQPQSTPHPDCPAVLCVTVPALAQGHAWQGSCEGGCRLLLFSIFLASRDGRTKDRVQARGQGQGCRQEAQGWEERGSPAHRGRALGPPPPPQEPSLHTQLGLELSLWPSACTFPPRGGLCPPTPLSVHSLLVAVGSNGGRLGMW